VTKCTVVEQSTDDLKFEGSNPAAACWHKENGKNVAIVMKTFSLKLIPYHSKLECLSLSVTSTLV
jgi:hypothetical protein